jgi:hypothetical protein
MHYMFDVAKCDRVFDYLLQKSKLNCQVVMSYRRRNNSKSMHTANGIILILMLLMIVTFFVNMFNRP